jgi:pullulanase
MMARQFTGLRFYKADYSRKFLHKAVVYLYAAKLTNMKKGMMIFSFIMQLFSGKAQQGEFVKYPNYTGSDLGLTYSPRQSVFRIWAPGAITASLHIYPDASSPNFSEVFPMAKDKNGTWIFVWPGDHKGAWYAFSVVQKDLTQSEIVPDPYAKAVGINGKRAVVIDMRDTNPVGWQADKSPAFGNKTDAVIYELHVRDASIASGSGIKHKGKFLGLAESGTKNTAGLATGLDHLKELGVTHIHLLPCFDFNSIDETNPDAKYNWGYDPLNYNVPEGSYATDAFNPITRIREFKQLVQAFHKNGLRVVMDVVYNHTALAENSNFNQLVPGYYYRQTTDGKFSNASACGNETASERPMMRKFILESMKYWVQEYHVDGFRVDLMGIHDIATMNLVSKVLHKIKPDILLYGEGWTAGPSPLPDSLRALKANAYKLDRIAVFSDDMRDGIKGHVFTHGAKGFASGQPGNEESVKFGIVAGCKHPQVVYSKVIFSKKPFASQPYQTVNFAECHDNHCLWDRFTLSAGEAAEAERVEMQKLALSMVLTSQGIPFLHAGGEFLRSKKGVENSFESPDSINHIDWDLKTKHHEVNQYIKTLIKIRRDHPAFRLQTAGEIASFIRFAENLPAGVISYTINGLKAGDSWKKIWVCFNGTDTVQTVSGGGNNWFTFIRDNGAVKSEIVRGTIQLKPYSCSILYVR